MWCGFGLPLLWRRSGDSTDAFGSTKDSVSSARISQICEQLVAPGDGRPVRAVPWSFLMQRRDFLKIAGLASSRLMGQQSFLVPAGSEDLAKTDFTLEI